MTYIYKSTFSNDIISFIKMKQSLGFSENTYANALHLFDTYCLNMEPAPDKLTQELVEGWSVRRETESPNGQNRRLSTLREFSKYLVLIGKGEYVVPTSMTGTNDPFVPYIYTDEEIKIFFHETDIVKPAKGSLNRELVLPVLFRMMFCCGLRPQETLKLRRENVDHDTGTLMIIDSKIHKDRSIVMAEDLADLCRKYDDKMEKIIPDREFYFQHPKKGSNYSSNWQRQQFQRCWRSAGIRFRNGRHPRVYDFRHNYATRTIARWMDEGIDVISHLPCLSEYMGHSSIEDTAYYIHLVPERFVASGISEWSGIPEVPYYED